MPLESSQMKELIGSLTSPQKATDEIKLSLLNVELSN